MEWYEESSSQICGLVPSMSKGESRISKTYKIVRAIRDIGMEIETCYHGFCL